MLPEVLGGDSMRPIDYEPATPSTWMGYVGRNSETELGGLSPGKQIDPITVDCFRLVVQSSTDAKQVTSLWDATCILALVRDAGR